MKITIKTIHTSISDDDKSRLRELVLKWARELPASTIVKTTFEEKTGPKRDGNKIVHMLLNVPGFKKTIFAKSPAMNDFKTALDIVVDRIDRQIVKARDFEHYGNSRPRYIIAKTIGMPAGLLRRLRRKKK